jgi:hypothetical protein
MAALPGADGRRLFLTRFGIAAISTAACTVGLLPAIVYLDRGLLLVFAIAAVALVSTVAAFHIQPAHLHQPGPLEFIAAGLSAISQGAIVSVMALVTYMTIRGLHWIAGWLLGWLGYELPFGWPRLATIFALGIGGLGLLGAVIPTVKGIWQALYPPVAGYPTPFRSVARSALGRAALIAGLVAAVAFTVFAVTWPLSRLGFWWCLAIAYLLAGATINAWSISQKRTAPRTFTTAKDAVGAILRAMGYAVVAQPRTGLPEIDPYLAELDFAVSRDDTLFAILVQEPDSSRRSDLECVTQVLVAAFALLEGTRKLGGELTAVQPVLVAVGPERGDNVSSFEPSDRVLVVRVTDPAVLRAPGNDEAQLRLLGDQLFGRLATARPEPVGIEPAASRNAGASSSAPAEVAR